MIDVIDAEDLEMPAIQILDRLAVVYLTRDSESGVLDDMCDVWVEQPERMTDAAGALWVGADDDSEECGLLFWRIAVEDVRSWLGTVPETDRECIAVRNPRSC